MSDETREVGKTKKLASLLWACGCIGIVVLGIAAVAGPKLISARVHGNETMAIGALKTIGTAQFLFREADKEGDGELDFGTLQELGSAGDVPLIDAVLASGTKSGYAFECAPASDDPEMAWWATANPVRPGGTGNRYFATNHEGVTFFSTSGPVVVDRKTGAMPEGVTPVGR